jgi:sensor c-di-GMP phosphodiesterase-like protein
MIRANQNRKNANLLLNLLWGLITAILLLVAVYKIWNYEKRAIVNQAQETADNTIDKIDKVLKQVTQSVHYLKITDKDLAQCKEKLIPQLQGFVINIPEVTALSVFPAPTDVSNSTHDHANHQTVCTTLPKEIVAYEFIKDIRPITISGPVNLNGIDRPVFIIQQKSALYYLNTYILESELVKLLKSSAPYAKQIALYDMQRKKSLLTIVQNKSVNNTWPSYTNQDHSAGENTKLPSNLTRYEDSIILDNIGIMVEIDKAYMHHLALRYILLSLILIALVSSAVFYSLRKWIQHHYSLHRGLMDAQSNNEFFAVYQPIMNRKTNSCCGAEVLLRWQASEHEVIMPDIFISYAEKTGLIIPITLQLAKNVFTEFASILGNHPDFHLAINFSSIHFSDPKFFKTFVSLCEKFNILSNQIILEVTERDLLQHNAGISAKMAELRELGFSIAIDDFGTGNSNISYLQRFPFNYLKIDRIFVSAIGTGAVTESLNLSIIEMANRLGLQVIAEGVETYEQLQALEELGAYLMQGWIFSKALPFARFQKFLQRNS